MTADDRGTDDLRFSFGRNWRRFLDGLNEERITSAERGLQWGLQSERLDHLRFLDVGSGSGLSSLAARRLGARVHSFDYDEESVACTRYLRKMYFGDDGDWTVERGSALDESYLRGLGVFDVVYSWGVLHHTGEMWRALDLVRMLVKDRGLLFLSIYNDQGIKSDYWRVVKRTYNQLPGQLRLPFTLLAAIPNEVPAMLLSLARRRPQDYVRGWLGSHRTRGMSRWHDLLDWVGGYPFEVAGTADVFHFYRERGFTLERLRATRGHGCNEYVFARSS